MNNEMTAAFILTGHFLIISCELYSTVQYIQMKPFWLESLE